MIRAPSSWSTASPSMWSTLWGPAMHCSPMRPSRCWRTSPKWPLRSSARMAAALECEADGNIPIGRPETCCGKHRACREAVALRVEQTGHSLMRVVVAGLGVQGHKRRRVAGADFVAAVDPVNPKRDIARSKMFRSPSYDAVLACIPDEPKINVLAYLLGNGKHVLVEKPLWAGDEDDIDRLEAVARSNGAVCYTAYNHRFEPHFVRMRERHRVGTARRALSLPHVLRQRHRAARARIRNGAIRAPASCPISARISSTPRVSGSATSARISRVVSSRCFENRAPDHVVLGSRSTTPQLELEMTLLSWRNHFTCDVFAENGSAHIRSLCKWGPVVHVAHAACCRADARPRRRSRWSRTIRPGRSNMRTSNRSARTATARDLVEGSLA